MPVLPLAEKGLAPLDGGASPSRQQFVLRRQFGWGRELRPVKGYARRRGWVEGTNCSRCRNRLMPQPTSPRTLQYSSSSAVYHNTDT